MQPLEAIKRQIDTADDLRSIVKTMKALAAVSIRQYEQAVASLSEYHRTVDLGLQMLWRDRGVAVPFLQRAADGRLGAIVFGSDQGLCGRFNDQVALCAQTTLHELEANRMQRSVLAVGTRVASRLEELGEAVATTWPVPASLAGVTPLVQRIVVHFEHWRLERHLERIILIHHVRLSGTSFAPQMAHLWPIDWSRHHRLAQQPWSSRSRPMFTMEPERLLSSLIRQHIFVSLYRAIAESLACEHASRLASMQAAERNIDDRLAVLQGQFRSQRQHAITEELLDIVAGFEALQPTAP